MTTTPDSSSLRRDLLLALVLFAVSMLVLSGLRDRGLDGRLNSDEPEWIAASILHWDQLVGGAPPAGLDQRPGRPGDSPWKLGFQSTTFGYMNPCLPKLIWGGVLAAAGHRAAQPPAPRGVQVVAFQAFSGSPADTRTAAQQLLAAEPLTRRVVLLLAALASVLLFFIGRATVPGRAGWAAGGVACGLWLASPLVRETATYIRTDHFMLPWCLGLWLLCVVRSETYCGGRGGRSLVRACLFAGLLGGLAVSSKLNGALAPIAFGLWVPAVWWLHRGDAAPRAPFAAVALGLSLAALTACAVFVALNPLLWSGPLAGVEDILARWEKLMSYFQNEWAPRTGVEVAHTLPERLSLFVRRTLERDEPLRALFGFPGGFALLLGAVALAAQAARRGAFELTSTRSRDRALAAIFFCGAFLLGTAAWLPLDWARLYLPATPALVLLEAALVAWGLRLFLPHAKRGAT